MTTGADRKIQLNTGPRVPHEENGRIEWAMNNNSEMIQKLWGAASLVRDCLFYFVLIVLTGVIFDWAQETSRISSENYSELTWAFCFSFLFQLVFFTLSRRAKKRGLGDSKQIEESANTKFKDYVYGWFAFFGLWLLVTGAMDSVRESPEYTSDFHFGLVFALVLALVMTTDSYIKQRLT